ncbi:hypothetical protein [uncultured Shimia sp.]|uniref:hypothetical protein n=1 Tax=uncultured Shimia sp. TaxID=573152 RepID=UPI002639E667|nr:hypothetical protein [uncultured Shimia sp.]
MSYSVSITLQGPDYCKGAENPDLMRPAKRWRSRDVDAIRFSEHVGEISNMREAAS